MDTETPKRHHLRAAKVETPTTATGFSYETIKIEEVTINYISKPSAYLTCTLCYSKEHIKDLYCEKHRLCQGTLCRLTTWYLSTAKITAQDGRHVEALVCLPDMISLPTHMRTCPICRAEVKNLTILTKLSAHVTPVLEKIQPDAGTHLDELKITNDDDCSLRVQFVMRERKKNQ